MSAARLSDALRALYEAFGYRQYRVGQFEEYDLYARNRNFLSSEQILTFSDTNGRLMALKPDVTLSIIKNTRDDRRVRKVWYTESVYRAPKNAHGFREIRQTGLECIGDVDGYAMGEVLMLAARSLEAVGREYVLDLSHMGILTGVLADAGAGPRLTADILSAMAGKNLHTLRSLCEAGGLSGETSGLLEQLCLLGGPVPQALPQLLALPLPERSRSAARELGALCELLRVFGDYPVNLDLSVVNDTDYYNGVLFHGFVDGAAAPVLSGGRYDHLLHRLGKSGGAIGFAMYMSELERLLTGPREYDVDVLLVYTPADDPARVARLAEELTRAGQTVRVQPEGEAAITWRRKLRPDGTEAPV